LESKAWANWYQNHGRAAVSLEVQKATLVLGDRVYGSMRGPTCPSAPPTGGPRPADTTDFAYLPATPANEAVFDLTPPAGFKQVPRRRSVATGQPGLGQIP